MLNIAPVDFHNQNLPRYSPFVLHTTCCLIFLYTYVFPNWFSYPLEEKDWVLPSIVSLVSFILKSLWFYLSPGLCSLFLSVCLTSSSSHSHFLCLTPPTAFSVSAMPVHNLSSSRKSTAFPTTAMTSPLSSKIPSCIYFSIHISLSWDFLGGPTVKNTPSNAGSLIPGQRPKIQHSVGWLSPHAIIREKSKHHS